MKLSAENQKFVDETWEKIIKKMPKVAERNWEKIPYTAENGRYDDKSKINIPMWTNGFWPGIMWLLYDATGEEIYKKAGDKSVELLDEALFGRFDRLHHDVGFMWNTSAKADYMITGNDRSRERALFAASILMGRYNIEGRFIRAWGKWHEVENTHGWTIIDCMMNIPLLYWATDVTGDDRFKAVAMSHADMAMRDHVRPDGSVYHICCHNPKTGEVEGHHIGQGYAIESSWSRGQSWAVYGFALSYLHTGKQEYLDTAKKVAHYFIANIADDGWLPRVDFRAPEEPFWYDTTAAACTACGLIEIAKAVPELEKKLYLNAALNILKAIDEKFSDYNPDTDPLLGGGSERYYSADNNTKGKHIPIIYGDYYYIEALYKLKGFDKLFW